MFEAEAGTNCHESVFKRWKVIKKKKIVDSELRIGFQSRQANQVR